MTEKLVSFVGHQFCGFITGVSRAGFLVNVDIQGHNWIGYLELNFGTSPEMSPEPARTDVSLSPMPSSMPVLAPVSTAPLPPTDKTRRKYVRSGLFKKDKNSKCFLFPADVRRGWTKLGASSAAQMDALNLQAATPRSVPSPPEPNLRMDALNLQGTTREPTHTRFPMPLLANIPESAHIYPLANEVHKSPTRIPGPIRNRCVTKSRSASPGAEHKSPHQQRRRLSSPPGGRTKEVTIASAQTAEHTADPPAVGFPWKPGPISALPEWVTDRISAAGSDAGSDTCSSNSAATAPPYFGFWESPVANNLTGSTPMAGLTFNSLPPVPGGPTSLFIPSTPLAGVLISQVTSPQPHAFLGVPRTTSAPVTPSMGGQFELLPDHHFQTALHRRRPQPFAPEVVTRVGIAPAPSVGRTSPLPSNPYPRSRTPVPSRGLELDNSPSPVSRARSLTPKAATSWAAEHSSPTSLVPMATLDFDLAAMLVEG
eukprot:TRINITY_DN28804_c0_g1_i1.p1 TRINITY_DN28804_c0_g1~~TRINITY_DN28804_c0_g1_i1.p1  ORF type:complete len:491 (+),score=23.79 TRINITY_DN28804_c0_g1_i1:27-1475(+)